MLLAAGADPNVRDKLGRAPLHLFLSGKWPWSETAVCIPMMVKAGADLSAKDKDGRTPLHYLAALGEQQPLFFIRGVDSVFLGAKVQIEARDTDGDTPLHIAAKTKTSDVFEWLVKQGASMDATNNAGETPRLLSARLPHLPGRPGSASAETDILQTARAGNVEATRKLLEADRKLAGQTNSLGQTPLLLAAMARRTNIVELLIKYGASWDAESAVFAGRADALHEILRQRPSAVATKSADGGSLMHIAVNNGEIEIVKMLLTANCDLRVVDQAGLSPLGRALTRKRMDVAEMLRQHGATENLFDAVCSGDFKTASALLEQDESMVSATNNAGICPTELAASLGHSDILKLLLDKGASVDVLDVHNKMTLLHLAALANKTNTVRLLIQRGADLEARDRYGFTALHWAAMQGATETATLLLENKANPNVGVLPSGNARPLPMMPGKWLEGDTALHFAALRGDTDLIRLLLRSGASINPTNSTGRTPLDLASQPRLPPQFVQVLLWNIKLFTPPRKVDMAPKSPAAATIDGEKAAAALLEASGGKHSMQNPRSQLP